MLLNTHLPQVTYQQITQFDYLGMTVLLEYINLHKLWPWIFVLANVSY